MEWTCPNCGTSLGMDDVNVARDLALCRACGKTSPFSELGEHVDARAEVAGGPPAGCWWQDDGVEMRVGATCRDLKSAGTLLFVSVFWNSIVAVFLVAAIGSLVARVQGAPASGNGISGLPWIGAIGLLVFLIPFVAIGAAMLAGLAMSVAGHVEVRIRGGAVRVYSGVGPIGLTRVVDAGTVTMVGLRVKRAKGSESDTTPTRSIAITGERSVSFGSTLSDARRRFVTGVLRSVLLGENGSAWGDRPSPVASGPDRSPLATVAVGGGSPRAGREIGKVVTWP